MQNDILEKFLRIAVPVFARPVFYKFWKTLHYISIRFMGIGNHDGEGNVTGEEWILKRVIKNHRIINFFDVGANAGQYSIQLKIQHPDIEVFAFEAHPKTFKRLMDSTRTYQKFQVHNVAIGDPASGIKSIKLYDYANSDGSEHASIHKEVFNDVYQSETIQYEVDLISLEEFCIENRIDHISFLKIDTEGSELGVIKGLGDFIRQSKIDFIQFEFNTMNLGKIRFYDFWILLEKNYLVYRLLPRGLAKISKYTKLSTEIYEYQNFLAVRKGIEI